MSQISIHRIQGSDLFSPLAGQQVTTRGVVIGHTRKGFFVQDPDGRDRDCSCGLFVFARRDRPTVGALVEVKGKVFDFVGEENDRPTTQLLLNGLRVIRRHGPPVRPVWLDAELLDVDAAELARRLNRLEGMLVGVPKGSVFVAPSNPFGDYVLLPPGLDLPRTPDGGVRIDPDRPLRWLPGFRIVDYRKAPRLDVGTVLDEPVVGPLNYRVRSYQIAAPGPLRITPSHARHETTTLRADERSLTVMTLNGFNLDPQVERAWLVKEPRLDIDDDVGDGRYRMLGRAIVEQAASPDVIALQEIQDDDGAEISANVSAERNFETLAQAVRLAGGPTYAWVDLPPEVDADGGQPGGNIRNAYFYRPDRVELVEGSARRFGEELEAFVDSRKPLIVRFRLKSNGGEITLGNVHLASKRHQYGLFAPEQPGFDPREEIRVAQAMALHEELTRVDGDVYVTGDFNDHEFSPTLRAFCRDAFVNLVEQLPEDGRFDYNHRGVSQALMHGIVRRRQLDEGRARYEILHGNELTGSEPGQLGDRPTDHAYVLARLTLG